MKKTIRLLACLSSLFITNAFADSGVNLVLTQGSDKAIPIAVVPFAGQAATGAGDSNIGGVIASDLRYSGQFKVEGFSKLPEQPHAVSEVKQDVWRKLGDEDVVVGSVVPSNGQLKVTFALVDLVKSQQPQVLLQQTYQIRPGQERALAHHISDLIFQQLVGVKGIFSTRIAYVQVSKTNPTTYSLLVADADGYNPRAILKSNEPIMSPAWSPDGKQLAYVSFEGKRAQIYVTDIATGKRRLISAASGINGAPAFSPDGKSLALVLSKSGAPKIYIVNLSTGQLQQLTTGLSIDTEPSFAPDGQSIIFTSDRGGSPQIYRYSLGSGKIDRVTFSGNYNARASYSRDGKQIVMIYRNNGGYNIGVQSLADGTISVITNSGRDDSPTFAPNGMMVLYGNEYGELGLVSVDGRVKLRVPGRGGKVQDPAWSPFLS